MAFRSSSIVSTASSSTCAPAVPSGTAEGDIIIVAITTQSAPSITPPAGFTEITECAQSSISGNIWLRVFWKRAGSSESGTYSFSLGSAMDRSAICCAYSGRLATGNPVSHANSAGTASAGAWPPVAVTTDVDGCDLIYICDGYTDTSPSSPTAGGTWSERADSSGYGPTVAFDRTQTTAGATGDVYSPTSSYLGMASALVALLPVYVETGTLNQHSFRFFNDDGSESGSTAKAALNTNINLSANDVARIRMLVDATLEPVGKQFQLEYRRKPSGGSFGPWERVN